MAKDLESKETYTEEEKRWILERLDAERKERQKYETKKKDEDTSKKSTHLRIKRFINFSI